LALPYYRRGQLVDMRCLLLQGGVLAGSWLAVGARELYMQRELQVGRPGSNVQCRGLMGSMHVLCGVAELWCIL
jgi:hypothetical protein